jgi:hypothetical protein
MSAGAPAAWRDVGKSVAYVVAQLWVAAPGVPLLVRSPNSKTA